MNRNNVTLLIGMIRAAKGAVSYIQQMAYVAIEAAGDKLYEYRATKAED